MGTTSSEGTGKRLLITGPDWAAIFKSRPDLEPPGYSETVADMLQNPGKRPSRGKARGKRQKNMFPSVKHGAD
jgi:hypothetical protein